MAVDPSSATAPAVVLLHAITRDRHDFPALLAHLGTRAQPQDLIGHGDAPRAARYHIADYAAAADLPPGRPVIFGHSLGGVVALAMAAAHPGEVAGLVLEDPPLFSSKPERMAGSHWERGFIKLHEMMTGEAARYGTDEWARALASWPSGHRGQSMADLGPDAVERRARQLAQLDPATLRAPVSDTFHDDFDVSAALDAAGCPIIVLAGEAELGSALSEEDLRLLAAKPGVRVDRIAGEGHFMHDTEAERCAAAIGSLLGDETSMPR